MTLPLVLPVYVSLLAGVAASVPPLTAPLPGAIAGVFQELKVMPLVYKGFSFFPSLLLKATKSADFRSFSKLMDFVALHLVNQLAVIKQGKDK